MSHFIICGDINYLKVSEDKTHLDNILLSYNLISITNFPTRVQNASSTAIDNIFIDVTQYESYAVTPITNGLSDHDAQFLKYVLSILLFQYTNSKLLGTLISIQY
jgi:hypothetical protein